MQQGYHSITMWSNPANFPEAEGSKSVPGVKIVHATGWPPMERRAGVVFSNALGLSLYPTPMAV